MPRIAPEHLPPLDSPTLSPDEQSSWFGHLRQRRDKAGLRRLLHRYDATDEVLGFALDMLSADEADAFLREAPAADRWLWVGSPELFRKMASNLPGLSAHGGMGRSLADTGMAALAYLLDQHRLGYPAWRDHGAVPPRMVRLVHEWAASAMHTTTDPFGERMQWLLDPERTALEIGEAIFTAHQTSPETAWSFWMHAHHLSRFDERRVPTTARAFLDTLFVDRVMDGPTLLRLNEVLTAVEFPPNAGSSRAWGLHKDYEPQVRHSLFLNPNVSFDRIHVEAHELRLLLFNSAATLELLTQNNSFFSAGTIDPDDEYFDDHYLHNLPSFRVVMSYLRAPGAAWSFIDTLWATAKALPKMGGYDPDELTIDTLDNHNGSELSAVEYLLSSLPDLLTPTSQVHYAAKVAEQFERYGIPWPSIVPRGVRMVLGDGEGRAEVESVD